MERKPLKCLRHSDDNIEPLHVLATIANYVQSPGNYCCPKSGHGEHQWTKHRYHNVVGIKHFTRRAYAVYQQSAVANCTTSCQERNPVWVIRLNLTVNIMGNHTTNNTNGGINDSSQYHNRANYDLAYHKYLHTRQTKVRLFKKASNNIFSVTHSKVTHGLAENTRLHF